MDRLASDYDRNYAITSLNNKKTFNLAYALAGQKMEYLKHNKTVRKWLKDTKFNLAVDRGTMGIADSFRKAVLMRHTLPGYLKTWYSKVTDPETKKIGALVAERHQKRVYRRIMNEMGRRTADKGEKEYALDK